MHGNCFPLGKEPLDAVSICRVIAILTAADQINCTTMLHGKSVITVINHLPYHLALLPYHIIDYLLVMSNTQGLLLYIQFTVIIRLLTMKWLIKLIVHLCFSTFNLRNCAILTSFKNINKAVSKLKIHFPLYIDYTFHRTETHSILVTAAKWFLIHPQVY